MKHKNKEVLVFLERDGRSFISPTRLNIISSERSQTRLSSSNNTVMESRGPKILGDDHQVEELAFRPKKIVLNKFFNRRKVKITLIKEKYVELLNIKVLKAKIRKLLVIVIPASSLAISTYTRKAKSVKREKNYMFWHIHMTQIATKDLALFFRFLPPNNNTNNLCAISRTHNAQHFQARNFLQNHALFDFRSKIFHTQEKIEHLKYVLQKLRDCDEIELFKNIMNPASNENKEFNCNLRLSHKPWQSLLKHGSKRHRGKKKQYASVAIYQKNGTLLEEFLPVYPVHKNKSNSPASLHCEEILIQQIDEYLTRAPIETIEKIKTIYLYTYNSPCLKREKHITPCMTRLLEKAHEWHSKYGYSTDVAFTECWGLRGPNVFTNLTYSEISCPSSPFYPYVEQFKNIPFQLDKPKDFKGKCGSVYRLIARVKNKKKCNEEISYGLDELVKLTEAQTCLKRQEHLDCGREKIQSFKFDLKDNISENWLQNWHEMVDTEAMKPIRDKVTSDFNTKVVQNFRKSLEIILGNSSPLQLYHVL